MQQENEETEARLRAKQLAVGLFDYDRVRGQDDPDQETLAETLAEAFGDEPSVNFRILAFQFLEARNCACDDIWPESPLQQSKDLKRLKKLIREICQTYNAIPDMLRSRILLAGNKEFTGRADPSQSEEDRAQAYVQSLLYRETHALKGYSGLQLLASYSADLLPCIDAAIESSKLGVPQGNKKIEAWRLMEACEHVCKLTPDLIEIPETLNSTGPFYKLVKEVFTLFEIDSDPIDIFRSYRDYVGRSRQ